MWSKHASVVFIILLTHSAVQGRKPPDQGVANLNCPLDDDPFNPTHLSYQGDCTKFLKCSYGKAYTLSCPRGLEWSIILDRCEAPIVANCDPTITTPKPVIGGPGCDFDYKRHPTDCDKAIQCVSGMELTIYCLHDMFWNQDQKKCVNDDSHC